MEERRKILIPVGSKPETPHFDAEETLLSARPVVPITSAVHADNFERAPAPFYKRNGFLVLVVMAAIGIGLAAGLGIARFRTQPAAPVAAQPVQQPAPMDTRTATVQPAKDNQQVPALPEVKTEERAAIKENSTEDEVKVKAPETPVKVPAKAPETSADKDDEAKTATPAPREKRRTSDNEEPDDATTPRAQKRERRERKRDDDTVEIPRSMQRAGEQINRIREIFEGRQRP